MLFRLDSLGLALLSASGTFIATFQPAR
jgi:hypothetical protein